MDIHAWKWLEKSTVESTERGWKLYAPENTDYFVDPNTKTINTSAPFLYQEISGDFCLRAKVYHDFVSTYDACALLAYDHALLWAKACFEYTDLGTHNIVSVMTNGQSDDANNAQIDGQKVWLQLSRKANIFAIHYSLDGITYRMARYTYLPMQDTIKVGFVAQSPLGKGGMRYFEDIELSFTSLRDQRNGNE